MAVQQLVYSSRPFGFDEAMLNGILTGARHFNAAHDITGALICRHDLFLQLLEGPQEIIKPLYQRIAVDVRHIEVEKIVERQADDRIFPKWAMRSDSAQSWLWTAQEVKDGALKKANTDQILEVFNRMANEIQN